MLNVGGVMWHNATFLWGENFVRLEDGQRIRTRNSPDHILDADSRVMVTLKKRKGVVVVDRMIVRP